jgi:hypothetical protein
VGLFSRLFGKKETAPAKDDEADPTPRAVFVLRRGMRVPDDDYVSQVVAAVFPRGLPESVRRIGMSQPSWYKTEEVADAIATSVVDVYARKLDMLDPSHVRRPVEGPDGCACLVIELYGE